MAELLNKDRWNAIQTKQLEINYFVCTQNFPKNYSISYPLVRTYSHFLLSGVS